MKTWFATLQAGIIALAFAAGGCAVSDVERLERTIVEKDYMANKEIAKLYELAQPFEKDGSFLDPPPDAVAASKRVCEELDRRERFFSDKCLSEITDLWFIFAHSGLIDARRDGYSMHILAIGDVLGHYGKTNNMIQCYGMLASNGLWQAQQRLYTLFLDDSSPHYSLSDAVFWLGKASAQGDGYAAEKLAKLYESKAVSGGNHETIGSLYDMAALSYLNLYKMQIEESKDEKAKSFDNERCLGLTFMIDSPTEQNEFIYSVRPYIESISDCARLEETNICNDSSFTITRCFQKAISHGNKEAEAHFRKYKSDLEYYRKNGTFPKVSEKAADATVGK